MFFDLVERIQTNYSYYRDLFNIRERNYRNDYAFAIADLILNGYTISTCSMPGKMLTVNHKIESLSVKDNFIVVKDTNRALITPRTNLHILSKKYLQSNDFQNFINNVSA